TTPSVINKPKFLRNIVFVFVYKDRAKEVPKTITAV
ncbi:MAG: hypothetical protein RLZ95_1065, partial [Bacteroidota bacterium]